MRKMNKLIALATAAVLAIAPASVASAATELESTGDINYVNTTIYKVTLPTNAQMGFTLDPQGLLALDNNGTISAEAGKIVGATSAGLVAKNESSVDVTLETQFYIVDSASTKATLVDASAGAASVSATAKEIGLTLTATGTNATPTTAIVPVTGTSKTDTTKTSFTMDKAVYEFGGTGGKYTYTLDTDTTNNYSSVSLAIGGFIAKDYDWSAYTGSNAETITLGAIFTFKNAEGNEVTNTNDATEVAMIFKDSEKMFYIANDMETKSALPTGTIANVKINNESCEYTFMEDKGWMTISAAQAKAALGTLSNTPGTSYTVTFTINGAPYTTTYTFE